MTKLFVLYAIASIGYTGLSFEPSKIIGIFKTEKICNLHKEEFKVNTKPYIRLECKPENYYDN